MKVTKGIKTMNKDISVLMSVYKNDVAKDVETAVKSVYNQTLKPKEIIMVVDGPVSQEILDTLENLKKEIDIFKVFPLEQNVGLGRAMNFGMTKCQYPFIARMDSDDIALPERFEKEMACFESNPDLDFVGSNCQEFIDDVDNLAGMKVMPETHEEFVKFMTHRCPFCHPTIIVKKEAVEKAGGYQDWYYAEDWYLSIRMYLNGAKFHNVQENLMLIRTNQNTYNRRGGMKYYKSIKNLLKFMYKNKMMNWFKYTKEKCIRFIGHVLVPRKLKGKMYRKYMRKNEKSGEKS